MLTCSNSYWLFWGVIFVFFQKIEGEQCRRREGAEQSGEPRHQQWAVGAGGYGAFVVEEIEHDDERIVEEMGSDIDQQRAWETEEIAQQQA